MTVNAFEAIISIVLLINTGAILGYGLGLIYLQKNGLLKDGKEINKCKKCGEFYK